jgi:hypothetical protein
MIDKAMQEFVQQNLVTLDELSRRYAEYRIEASKSYLDELRTKIGRCIPDGYRFDGIYRISSDVEQVCGWSRDLEILNTKTTVKICFAFLISGTDLAGGWPLMNGGCWTGIRIWLPPRIRDIVIASAGALALHTEPPDDSWVLWRLWEALSGTSIEGFHKRLTGEDRATGQDEIVGELIQWKADFEKVLSNIDNSHK